MNISDIKERIEKIKEGEISAINCHDVYFFFKEVELLQEEFKEITRKNLEKYSSDELKPYNIEKKSGRAIYSFSHIPEHAEAKSKIKSIEEMAKLASKKGFSPEIINVVDEETGEILERPTIMPAHVTYTPDIYIFKK